ncbi:MAG: hypothetical protein ABSC56_04300 [Solirubrobacteraceae bacterium]|jgi:hypothetical protein
MSTRPAQRRRFARRREHADTALAAVAAAEEATFGVLVRLVVLGAGLIAALIALAIALRLLDANAHNGIVHAIHVAANFFAGSFTTLFRIHGPRLSLLVNWGIALCAYLVAGALVAAVIRRIANVVTPRSRAARA